MYDSRINFNHVELNVYDKINATGLYRFENILQSQREENFDLLHEKLRDGESFKSYILQEGLIRKMIHDTRLIVLDPNYSCQVMKDLHRDYGHIGGRKLWLLFRNVFYCKNDRRLAKKVVRQCVKCIFSKSKNRVCNNEIKSILVENVLDLVCVDFIGNLIPGDQGYSHIFVITDIFSKFVRIYPTHSYNTDTALECIQRFINRHGRMNRLLADNATYFQNEKFKTTLSQQNIEVIFSSIRHPCGNPTERYIQEVTKFLRLLTHEHHEDWVRHVQSVEDFINHTPHTVTEECPAYLMNRRMPPTPWDPFPEEADDYDTRVQRVREKLRRAADSYVRKENSKITKRTIFHPGDTVLVKSYRLGRRDRGKCAKLDLPYVGPYTVVRNFNDVTYELYTMDGKKKIGRYHVSSLFPYDNNPT
ncbi:Integrase zinc binding domain [Popillia japonica]|uniref:RNA-directed DNA polymerase n=1 Tax=Popillia japonica TaxID=7064 RepID=A0AAW1MHW1_POPJA